MDRIGLVTPYWGDLTKDELVEFAAAAEELGYDSLWVPEMWGRDALSLLSALAVKTHKIKLCTGVVSVFSRTPAAIASAIATIDELSGGRAVLGLGTSGPAVIENWHGMKFDRPLQRIREYVEIIRLVLSGERVNYEGEIFSLRNFRLQFSPPRSDIPIFIASLGPKSLCLTAELADGWIPFLVPREAIKNTIGSALSEAGPNAREAGDIAVAPYIPSCVFPDVEASVRVVKEHVAYYVGGMGDYYLNALSRWGFGHEAEVIRGAWEKGNKQEALDGVTDRLIGAVSIVSGGAAEGVVKIRDFIGAGATLPVVMFPLKATREMVRSTMEALAPA